MKILFLSPNAELGGAEQVLLTMTAMLRQHAPDVELAAMTFGDGPLVAALQGQGVNVVKLEVPRAVERLGDSQLGAIGKVRSLGQVLRALPGLWRLRRAFRKSLSDLRPDLIHSNGIKMHLLARLAGVGSIPVIWHIQDFYGSRPVTRQLLSWAVGGMTEAIAISRAVADDFRTVVGPRPVTVILNAIDLTRFRPRPPDTFFLDPADDIPPPETLRIGLIATYARWKGQDIFMRAAAKILHILPNLPARFYLIGGPVYRTAGSQFQEEELRELARKIGISEKIRIICFQNRPELVYSNLDIVVHASVKPEPFGLTIIEAMACGRAVIASLAGGVTEIVDNGDDALGTPPGDVDALVGALQALMLDAGLRGRLGTNARSKVERLFDRNRLGSQLWAVYQRLLSQKSGRMALRD